MEINISFNEDHIRDAYFRDYDFRIQKNEVTKFRFRIAVVCVSIAFFFTLLYRLEWDLVGWLWFSYVMAGTSLVVLLDGYMRVRKWRRGVEKFIRKNKKIKVNTLYANDDHIYIRQDDDESYDKWESFEKIVNRKGLFMFFSKHQSQFLIPKASLTEEEIEWIVGKISGSRAAKQNEEEKLPAVSPAS